MHSRPRILLTRRWPSEVEDALAVAYELVLNDEDRPMSAAALVGAMADVDALCPTVTDRIDADILTVPLARVRVVANYGAGTDHIDLAAARATGLPVTNTPDVLTDATADMALLLILMTSRRAIEGERELRDTRWQGWAPTHLMGRSLAGKMLGIVGFGRIGRALAHRGRALGLQIGYTSRTRDATGESERLGARYFESIGDLATACDVLSLHCRGGVETHHLVNAALLRRMKPSAIVINTARGSVIDEVALAGALRDGVIAAAGLDVFECEPLVNPGLLAAPNTVLMPHLGSATRETRVAMGMRVKSNLDAFFDGRPLPDRVA